MKINFRRTFLLSPHTVNCTGNEISLPPGDAIIQVRPARGSRPIIPVTYRDVTVNLPDGETFTYRERTDSGL